MRSSAAVSSLLLVLATFAAPVWAQEKPDAVAADETSRSLEPLLAGEFALQAGKLDEAAKAYLDAAKAADDAALAGRATRIALLAKDDKRAAHALDQWRSQRGEGLSVTAAEAVLAIRARLHSTLPTNLRSYA